MPGILVLGASRGIGLEFATQYRAAGWTVFATFRGEDDRIRLRDLGCHTLKLDVQRTEDIAGIAWQLDGEKLDVAIVNAGVYGLRTSTVQSPPTDEQFDLVMRTNVLGAMRLLPILAPLLAPAQGTLAFVSSRMGSIAEAQASYGMLYRVSKAAVNMVAKMAHADYSPMGIRVLSLHPGWVRTDMGGPNADVAVTDSVTGLRDVIADRKAYPSGGFLDYRGQAIPW
ncbi:MAG: SDR family oxidoreductase [Burkholderiales bacterium]|jgi:NAD(P)-dependent dehydrogenase (short-subunit alcohol dehydrogenase family)